MKRITPGNYTLATLEKALESRFDEEKIKLRFENAEVAIVIENSLQRTIKIYRDLTALHLTAH